MNYSLFEGKNILLTAWRDGDEKIAAGWQQDAEYLRNLDSDIAMPKTEVQIKEFSEEMSKSKNDMEFLVRLKETDELIGFVALDGIEWNNARSSLAIGIGNRKHRGKGYGKEAMELILQFAFTELNLHRVELNYFNYNENAGRLYESLGFKHEGAKRDFVHRDGKYFDLILMGLLRHEWEEMQNSK